MGALIAAARKFRWADAAVAAGYGLVLANCPQDHLREPRDEGGMGAYCWYAHVMRNIRFSSKLCVFDVELDQCLGVLAKKCDRRNNNALMVGSGPANFHVGRRPDPLERADTTLVAKLPIQADCPQSVHNRLRSFLHLPSIGIAARNHALRSEERRVGKE